MTLRKKIKFLFENIKSKKSLKTIKNRLKLLKELEKKKIIKFID